MVCSASALAVSEDTPGGPTLFGHAVSVGGTATGGSHAAGPPPPGAVGDFVTFNCPFGSTTLGGTTVCYGDTSLPDNECIVTPSCTYYLNVSSLKGGETWSYWKTSGDASVQCYNCEHTNATFSYPSSGRYSGEIFQCMEVSISHVTVVPRSWFEDYWINWTDPAWVSSTFQWGLTTSYGLPTPTPTGTSIELNDLNASTTYYYKITDTDNCGDTASYTGQFTTTTASSTSFAGFLFQRQLGNPHLLYPAGAALQNGFVTITAGCSDDNLGNFAVPFAVETNATGYYYEPFPLTYQIAEGSQGTIYFEDYTNGSCVSSESGGSFNWGPYWFHNALYNFNVSAAGYWNDTRDVSSALTSTNDWQEFVIQQDNLSELTVGLSLLDLNSNTSSIGTVPVQCGYSMTAGVNSTVSTYAAGNGQSSGYGNENTWGASMAGWGVDTGIEVPWYLTGATNDTTTTQSKILTSTYPIGPILNSWSPSPSTTVDWVTPPAYVGQDPTSPWVEQVPVPSSYTISNPDTTFISMSHTATFTSTSGVDMDIDVGVSLDFVDVGTSVQISYENTVTHSHTSTMSCEVYDPAPAHSGEEAMFWYYEDGGVNGYSDILHVAFMGYCGGSSNITCT
jgi:hypothetical protein